jgi:hypothetical protein
MPFASDRDPGLGQPDTGGTTGFEPVTACPLHVPAPPHMLPSFPSCLFASYGAIVIRPHTGRLTGGGVVVFQTGQTDHRDSWDYVDTPSDQSVLSRSDCSVSSGTKALT